MMVEVGPSSEENNQSAAQPQPRHDFSGVQGFQVLAEGHVALQMDSDQAWREALRLELEARAARFHQAVDAAIVLSNDGVIRWLGDPVARLSLGPTILNPGTVILADDSLSVESRETIKTRIELWITATTRRILGPLFALEAVQEGSETVRDLARELAKSLGVLEREPIKAKIKALSQDDRAELRKQGVRFGAYYLFVPALIKPAARNLALQLWGLHAPGDASELLRTLGPVASSGRTSLPLDMAISKEGYRVAGYRPCGERIVRVDVVERLAGIIRAAIAGEAPGRANHRTAKGFVVTGDMTSLTGCSGEQFASILRSIGFRPVEMKRSDFFKPLLANEAAGQVESPTPTEDPEPSADDQASSPTVSAEEITADTVLAARPTEPISDAAPDGVDAVSESAETVPADVVALLVSPDASDGASGVDAEAQAGSQPTSDSRCESAENADVVVVWRPDHRRISPNREREGRQSATAAADAHGHVSVPAPKRPPRPAAHLPARQNRRDTAHANEKRRQPPTDYGMARPNPATAPQQKPKVDPNSPFAKLLELRPLLEEQANKRP
jgi:ATP-dependent RNA helicase SUPV3L1/SUV3